MSFPTTVIMGTGTELAAGTSERLRVMDMDSVMVDMDSVTVDMVLDMADMVLDMEDMVLDMEDMVVDMEVMGTVVLDMVDTFKWRKRCEVVYLENICVYTNDCYNKM
ncbi:hypothetical protein TNCV_4579921 [Trichonephila clavipes]|nr:hypothetical protein TNCV_4579921 [Trichonephila clavipes]